MESCPFDLMWQVAVKMQALKICVVCVYKVYTGHKWISSSDLGPIPKISHESEEIPKSKHGFNH